MVIKRSITSTRSSRSVKSDDKTSSTIRVVSILNCFTQEKNEMSAYEISRKSGVPMTTAYRILSDLTKGHLVERDAYSGEYRVGVELYYLGSLYLNTQSALTTSRPIVKMLNDLTNECVFLSVSDKGNIVITLKEESKHSFRMAHGVGSIFPSHASAMGKAFLGELNEIEIDSLYPNENLPPSAKKTIRTKAELKFDLEQIRKTGVAFAREENHDGEWGIASLIRNADGVAVAAMGIAIPVQRLHQDIIDHQAELVRKGAKLISYRMGYKSDDNLIVKVEDIRSWWKKISEGSSWII